MMNDTWFMTVFAWLFRLGVLVVVGEFIVVRIIRAYRTIRREIVGEVEGME